MQNMKCWFLLWIYLIPFWSVVDLEYLGMRNWVWSPTRSSTSVGSCSVVWRLLSWAPWWSSSRWMPSMPWHTPSSTAAARRGPNWRVPLRGVCGRCSLDCVVKIMHWCYGWKRRKSADRCLSFQRCSVWCWAFFWLPLPSLSSPTTVWWFALEIVTFVSTMRVVTIPGRFGTYPGTILPPTWHTL